MTFFQLPKGFFHSTPRRFESLWGVTFLLRDLPNKTNHRNQDPDITADFNGSFPTVTADPFQTGQRSNQTSGRAQPSPRARRWVRRRRGRRHSGSAGGGAADAEGSMWMDEVRGRERGELRARRFQAGARARRAASLALSNRKEFATPHHGAVNSLQVPLLLPLPPLLPLLDS